MKNRTKRDLLTYSFCAALIILACVITGVIRLPVYRNKVKPIPVVQGARVAILEYLSKTDDSRDWWMSVAPPVSLELADVLAQNVSNILHVINRARGISARTEEIAREYNSFFTSVYEKGHSKVVMKGSFSADDLKGQMEVCFFSREDYPKHPSILYFNKEWNAIMMGSLRWPEAFFGGILFHELNHALLKKQRGTLVAFSDEWFMEEVSSHQLEAEVINALVSGRYFAEVDRILDYHSGTMSYGDLLSKLKPQDFASLDRSIDVQDCGGFIKGTSCAQHVMTLGLRFLERRQGSDREKVALYKLVRSRQ